MSRAWKNEPVARHVTHAGYFPVCCSTVMRRILHTTMLMCPGCGRREELRMVAVPSSLFEKPKKRRAKA